MSKEVHCLFKFANNPYGGIEIDTTSGSGIYKDLSPFNLGPIDTWDPQIPKSKNFENLWQFSKVYRCHLDEKGNPSEEWFKWRSAGWLNSRAIRYPMGKGAIPEYSFWSGEKLKYIEARKTIYAPLYARYVVGTDSFKELKRLYSLGVPLVLRDYDAYDHIKLGMSLKDVINNPSKKCGHAFILAMILTNELEECLR